MMLRLLTAVAAGITVAALPGSPWPRASAARQYPWRVELNIPAFRVDVLRDSVRIRSFGVAVGSRQFPTPRGSYTITEIVWNPWWYPPPSGWAKEDTVTPPGPRNPMGRVKLQLADVYYIHGTPLEQSIGSAASHGCIRMRNADAIALARLLQEGAGITMNDDEIERLIASRRTRIVPLADSVSIALVYRTAEVYAETLALHPDVYRLGVDRFAEAAAALFTAGIDSVHLDGAVLDSLIGKARTAAVRVPVSAVRSDSAIAVVAPRPPMQDDAADVATSSGSRRAGPGCLSP
ncbi:MAG TPA: L,D-transpeptidase [Gemmatimonadaceae bacterium]|nr:L,D-transpeptidase [Gemmatimonadaceae bacterium]